jgi:hypothetical protein
MRLKPKKSLNNATNDLRRLISLGMDEGLWTTVDECARKIGVKPNTFSQHTFKNLEAKFLEEDFLLLGNFLTQNRVKFKTKFYSPAKDVSKSPTPDATGPPPHESPHRNSIGNDGQLAGTLESFVAAICTLSRPYGVISGTLFNEVLSGVAEFGDQVMDGVRFVLRDGTFRKLDGKITDAEIDDTRRLIAELRRRFGIFAQLDAAQHRDQRQRLGQALVKEVELLMVAIRQAHQVIPTSAEALLHDREEAKKVFNLNK